MRFKDVVSLFWIQHFHSLSFHVLRFQAKRTASMGLAMSLASLVRSMLHNSREVFAVSTMVKVSQEPESACTYYGSERILRHHKIILSRELGSEWASKRTSERNGARERSEHCVDEGMGCRVGRILCLAWPKLVPCSQGYHGLADEVFLSLPCVLGDYGVCDVIKQPLAPEEVKLLQTGTAELKAALAALKF